MAERDAITKFSAVLDGLDDPFFVCGRQRIVEGALALVFADGKQISITNDCVDELLTRSEAAPFGDGTRTRHDSNVRHAMRLVDRGAVRVLGFDIAALLPEIERVLSPREHIEAMLLDVQVYPVDGHFDWHKDTPRNSRMMGTCVVELPVEYQGGTLVLETGLARIEHRAYSNPCELSWIAFFGDVDHRVERVQVGYRVSLTYSLQTTGESRRPEIDRVPAIRGGLEALFAGTSVAAVLVPCARRVVVERGREMTIANLRGLDREIAEAALEGEYALRVVPCVAFVPADGKPNELFVLDRAIDIIRLKRPLTRRVVLRLKTYVSLVEDVYAEEDLDVSSLATEILDDLTPELVMRDHVQASLIHEAVVSSTGYFGNEHFDAWFYAFVGMQISRGRTESQAIRQRARHKKFGEGVIVSESRSATGDAVLTVRFDDGSVRKLLAGFVERVG